MSSAAGVSASDQKPAFLGRWAWMLLVVIGLYSLVTLPILLRYPPVWPDEVLFASPGYSLARGQGMSTSVLAGFIPGMERYTFWLPPGYFVALAGLFRLLGLSHGLVVMRLFSWLLGLLLLLICWTILKRLTSRSWIPWLSLILLATHASFVRAANLGRMEMLTLVCTVGAVASYLGFLEGGRTRRLAVAGFLSGLAAMCHPAGMIALTALALHWLASSGIREGTRRGTVLFFASASLPILPWLVYISRAPDLFLTQFGGQIVRKVSSTGTALTGGTVVGWLLRPLKAGEWAPIGLSSLAAAVSTVLFLAAILFLMVSDGERSKMWALGVWLVIAYALNLFTLEQWYPIYFVVPMVLALGCGPPWSRFYWGRSIGLLVLFVGIAWNVFQIKTVFSSPYGSWSDYKSYASAIAARIPPGSSVLLEAIPDPYFGLLEENKGYRLYEFVPEGVRVNGEMAGKAMASVDYVVDSGCCKPSYILQYIRVHGALTGGVMSPDRGAGPVQIWKLGRK